MYTSKSIGTLRRVLPSSELEVKCDMDSRLHRRFFEVATASVDREGIHGVVRYPPSERKADI
jgi:hypothetical protein